MIKNRSVAEHDQFTADNPNYSLEFELFLKIGTEYG